MKNSLVALVIYFVNLVLNIFSRQVFIQYLGAEVLGLNTTATSLLQFLNLAELGIGTAIGCTLYKPLLDDDHQTINEIVSLQGWLYRRIAMVVIVGSAILMVFFPWIFNKMELPLWYAYASFGVLLFSSLLSYFINYKEIVLSANQEGYKINYSYKSIILLKILVQIFAIKFLDNGYIAWLILEVVFAIIAAMTLNYTIRKSFPYLVTDVRAGKALKHKYPDIVTKIKQLFFHKIGGFVLTQTSPIIIYSYATLTLVAIYGNYMLIVMGLSALLIAMFNGLAASVGNLVAEGEMKSIISVFRELYSSRFCIISILSYGIYKLSPGFITLWVGESYILDNISVLLIIAIFFIQTERETVISFLNAYGLFQDIWAPIAEASINLGLSILLGYFFGLHGILVGIFLSLFFVIFLWKPYLLFSKGFKRSIKGYVTMYAKHLILLAVSILMTEYLFTIFPLQVINSISTLIINCLIVITIFGLTLTLLLYIFEKGMKSFVHRILHIFIRK